MSALQQQVRRARNRLWFGIWLEVGCRVVSWAAAAFALLVLLARLWAWPVPWLIVAGATALAAMLVSIIWSWRIRPADAEAAAALDAAAGLRERLSSSLLCHGVDDPFADAVHADAEAKAAGVTVSQHLRFRAPSSLSMMGGAMILAGLMFLMPEGLLLQERADAKLRDDVAMTTTRVEVKKQLDEVKKLVQTNPALSDLQSEIDKLETMPADRMDKPSDIRHEAIKKIDKLADAVRQKQTSEKFDKVNEMKKMLRALKDPSGEKTPVQKLSRQLAAGDFKEAKETLKELQEQLATLKQDSDKELVKNMEKQLAELAKQLESISDQEQLKKKLEQAGIKKEDLERMLERLNKEDLEQIKKKLEESGMSQKQIEQIAQQAQKQQAACQACKQMSQAMNNAAQAAGAGQSGDAMGAMEMAGEQLSEMEMLEQEMNQLDSSLSSLQDAKEQMNNQCKACNGAGCDQCNGTGQGPGEGQGQGQGQGQGSGGMGKQGQGRGGLANKQETGVGFKIERGKVESTKGKIVGQFLVDGEQIKGEASQEFVELMAAAERTATDTINRDRIPRQYQKAIKEYFSRLPAGFGLKFPAVEAEEDAEGEVESDGKGDGNGETPAEEPSGEEAGAPPK